MSSITPLVQSVDWLAIAPPTRRRGRRTRRARRRPLPPGDAGSRCSAGSPSAGLAASALFLLPLLDGDRAHVLPDRRRRRCSYVADRFTLVIQFLVLGGALLVALLSVTALKDADRDSPTGEYWFLLLSSAAGAALLPASRDLATLIVALEVASLPAFALVGIGAATGTPRKRR